VDEEAADQAALNWIKKAAASPEKKVMYQLCCVVVFLLAL
jgi:hypothetical protein